MGTLTVENLSKSYGDVQALEDVSFELSDDEFAVVLGVSGAGKSTLLRCLNGLTTPTSGGAYLDGERIGRSRADVAMIFQQHNLIDGLSAYANALTGSLHRTSFLRSLMQWNDHEDKLGALSALEAVGLLDSADQHTKHMSGGQQQRVGIARALVQQPGLLLADEPVASLDPKSAETVMRYLRTAATERNLTTVASLHQVPIARQFGERFLGLKDGQLIFDGPIGDLTPETIEELYGTIETGAIRESETESTEETIRAPVTRKRPTEADA